MIRQTIIYSALALIFSNGYIQSGNIVFLTIGVMCIIGALTTFGVAKTFGMKYSKDDRLLNRLVAILILEVILISALMVFKGAQIYGIGWYA